MRSLNPDLRDVIGLLAELGFRRAPRLYCIRELSHVGGRDGWPGAELVRNGLGGGSTESIGLVCVYIGDVNTSGFCLFLFSILFCLIFYADARLCN